MTTNPNIAANYQDAFLSKMSYEDQDEDGKLYEVGDRVTNKDDTSKIYTIISISKNNLSDYQAYALKDEDNGNITISNRGTSSFTDVVQDSKIGLDILPEQVKDAVVFTNQVADLVKQTNPNFTVSDIHQTGHSLGGGIAQLLAVMNNSTATTFNAPPVSHLIDNLHSEYPSSFDLDYSYFVSLKDKISDVVERDDAIHDLNPFTNDLGIGTRITIDTPNIGNSKLMQAASSLSLGTAALVDLMQSLDAHRMSYIYNLALSQKNNDPNILSMEAAAYYSYLDDYLNVLKVGLDNLISDSQTISSYFQSYLDSFHVAEGQAAMRVDPLTLDLDGDGVELVNVADSKVFFDLDVVVNSDGSYVSDGVKEKVGWVAGDDGLERRSLSQDFSWRNGRQNALRFERIARMSDSESQVALDKNNNGVIDNIWELFGKSNLFTPISDSAYKAFREE